MCLHKNFRGSILKHSYLVTSLSENKVLVSASVYIFFLLGIIAALMKSGHLSHSILLLILANILLNIRKSLKISKINTDIILISEAYYCEIKLLLLKYLI